MYYPTFKKFAELAGKGNLIPLYREILADMETPVITLKKLRDRGHVFLFESVEGGEKWGRYTFIGADPHTIIRVKGDDITVQEGDAVSRHRHEGDPLRYLRDIMKRYKPVAVEGLPRFYGGAVGFFAYDMVRYFERLPCDVTDDLHIEDAVFLLTDTMIIFDNIRHTIKVVACALVDEGMDLKAVYNQKTRQIDAMIDLINVPLEPVVHDQPKEDVGDLRSNMTPDAFKDMVKRAKEYIVSGDAIQIVLSQRFEKENGLDSTDLYRALRYINPSPYLFYLKLDDCTLIGSSPEVMVRLEEKQVELRPIAGTRPRGKTEQEDRELAAELLNDPKEKAEHIMLVDLGRNDLGRIARIGTVQVNQLMIVERYSHVMHLVSNIQAQLSEGKDCFDVLKATFPAGTLSGAPKIRAMEIIDELERVRRGPYGGAVGYFSYTGNMDFCITIRTMVVKNGKIFIQVGAGIVADSDPEKEYEETLNKAGGMMQAIKLASSNFAIGEKR
jgi:anthranilate synthase component 1